MPKEEIQHVDILGQPLAIGNYVATSQSNNLYICQIVRMTTKMIRVRPIKWRSDSGWLKYPVDLVVLSGPDALAYILKNSGT